MRDELQELLESLTSFISIVLAATIGAIVGVTVTCMVLIFTTYLKLVWGI